MAKVADALKRVVVGRPMSSGELEHTLLPKSIALPVFASDALSSMAYATQEVLLVLGTAGLGALPLVFPLSGAVAVLLAIVIVSYRQIVRAYPGGGGAYVVAHENLGMYPGLTVAASLLIDYVLTVAVSITAGTDAIVSAAPGLADHKVIVTISLIGLVTLANLRGSKESGRIFAVPTYGFILCMYALIITGLVRCVGSCPQAETAGLPLEPEHALTAFLLLKAFAAGTTALTGVEAIAEGVPVFRFPQSKNAASTLAILGVISISLFLGVSWLADHTNVVFQHGHERTVMAQIGHAVFGGGLMFYVLQVLTALILVLAANTAYTGFPVLASILARNRIMPRQFVNRGDRLVYSNGIVILAVFASILVYVFDADLNRLIQLYLLGVFLSFTLAQAGTVMRWRRTREPGWQKSATINAFGAIVTGVVMVVVLLTKFMEGAWIVVSALPVIIFMMRSVHGHYSEVRRELGHPERVPQDRRPGNQHMVMLVTQVDAASARAVGYARSVRPASIVAITFDKVCAPAWSRLAPEIELRVLQQEGSRTGSIKNFLRERRRDLSGDDFLTFVVSEVLRSRSMWEIAKGWRIQRTKASLRREAGVQVLDVPVVEDEITPGVDQAREPARNYVSVLISGVNNASLQAMEFAETLRPTSLRGVHFGLDPEEAEKIGDEWLDRRVPHPLEIENSPFRDIGLSLISYIRSEFDPDGVNRVATVVIPEFIVRKRRHEILHNQTALVVIKRRLLFEPGVVVVSVPFYL